MSAVSSTGSNGTDLFQVLQSLTQQNASTSSSTSAAAISDPNSSDAQPASSRPHHAHHHHGVTSKIESAITTALQSSDGSEDPNQVVKDAISKALQTGNGDAAGGESSIPSSQTPSAVSSPTDGSSAFSQLLQSYGINAQQFQQDLQSALSSNSSGGTSVDFSALFKSFPPGSAIEATG